MKVENKEQMNIVFVGHVDHGKSTIIGRLLNDTNTLPNGKIEQIKEQCKQNSKSFEYAFLIDALKDEQAQGITIDSARIFFKTKKRNYMIIDAPGHIEFIKNMVTGASHAEVAFLVIDANEGIKENSKRHCYLLSMLGVKKIVVLVNKMDLVDYSETRFNDIVNESKAFLNEINIELICFIPVSGRNGDNISCSNQNMNWYNSKTVLEVLDSIKKEESLEDKPFRMPVQDVYKFTSFNDDRRIVAGTVISGNLKVNDEIIFYPSGKKSSVKIIEKFDVNDIQEAKANEAIGFTLNEQIYVKRGDVACKISEKSPIVSDIVKVNMFWLGEKPFIYNKAYILKTSTTKTVFQLEKIVKVIDSSSLDYIKKSEKISKLDVAECVFKLKNPICFDDPNFIKENSKFVIVDNYDICGGGILLNDVKDDQKWIRDYVTLRNIKWERSGITQKEREDKYNQKSRLILITGKKNSGRKKLAKELEKKLFSSGRLVYYLGIANVLYGVDADIKFDEKSHREEHLRRLSEVVNILMDSGQIVIVTAQELTNDDLEIFRTVIDRNKIDTVWLGDEITAGLDVDLHLSGCENEVDRVNQLYELL